MPDSTPWSVSAMSPIEMPTPRSSVRRRIKALGPIILAFLPLALQRYAQVSALVEAAAWLAPVVAALILFRHELGEQFRVLVDSERRDAQLSGAVALTVIGLAILGAVTAAAWPWVMEPAAYHRLTPQEARAPYLKGLTFYAADLAAQNEDYLIENRTFEDCTILGPAAIWANPDNVKFDSSGFDADPEWFVLEVPDGVPLHGIIKFKNVVFRNCRFRHIKLLAQPGTIASIRGRPVIPRNSSADRPAP